MPRTRKTTRDVISGIISDLPKGVHLSAQELKDRMEEHGRSVSLSTVYRALDRLNDEGEVRSIMSTRGQLWEVADDDEQHDHLICTRCGITIEFSDTLVSGFGRTLAERKGYEYQESRFDIYGYCSSCKGRTDQMAISSLREIMAEIADYVDESGDRVQRGSALLEEGRVAGVRDELVKLRGLIAKALEKCDEGIDLL